MTEFKKLLGHGGEALLYPNITELFKIARENNVKNKLITNGLLLLQKDNSEEIYNNLDYLVLSIDSISNETNLKLGRGINHYNTIKEVLDYTRSKKIKIGINTVITKENVDELEQLGEFLNQYKIDTWKFFKFVSFRETARKNRNLFEITNDKFEEQKRKLKKYTNIRNIKYKTEKELEKSILILANRRHY